jgi:CMP-N,N'-diacetyllegionaminic acid synthase
MNTNPKVLAIIPARGKSKGLPRKNVLDAGGKPLIAWTIEAAQKSHCITKVILSSDNAEIISVARDFGCDVPFVRPAALATDTASTLDVVLHAMDQVMGYDFVITLQPTSPLRTASDIDAAFDTMIASGAPSCVSVCEVNETPYWMFSLGRTGKLNRLIDLPYDIHRRQDLPKSYKLNGAIYIIAADVLRKTKSFTSNETVAYIMDRSVSIDVDTQFDFERIKKIYKDNYS